MLAIDELKTAYSFFVSSHVPKESQEHYYKQINEIKDIEISRNPVKLMIAGKKAVKQFDAIERELTNNGINTVPLEAEVKKIEKRLRTSLFGV